MPLQVERVYNKINSKNKVSTDKVQQTKGTFQADLLKASSNNTISYNING